MTTQSASLAVPEKRELTTPMSLLQLAIERDGSIDVIERLAKLQREEREYQAKVDFDEGLNRCQQQMRRISADAVNPQTKSRYATYAKLDTSLRPIYSQEGFSLSFSTEDAPHPEMIRVTCLVSKSGHERKYQIDMPADGKGAKGGDVMTKTHATGAAATYGMRYLLKMIFNVAIGEDDTDGNQPTSEAMHEATVLEWIDAMNQAPDMNSLKGVFADCWAKAKAARDQNAKNDFQKSYEANKRRLGGK